MRRLDIDGLRALAVLMVVAFHAFPSIMPGGFIGVDVFFVISGYLISGHILEAVARNRFSFWEFYAKRCRRILPALLLVLLCVWILGRNSLLSGEYSQLGKHVLAGAAFVSNITLYQESGYFDGAANLKPLLHLWSLAIEEQFYLLWPVLLFSVRKKRSITALIGALAVGSFSICLYETTHNIKAAFFLLPSRFWELLVGAALAHIELSYPSIKNRFANLTAVFAVGLLAFGGFFLQNNFLFPGLWALIPTVSAFLFISAGQASWLNRKVFSSIPFTFIGLMSYPL
jgi:peptidoglycan/LPS O-acetylase OafA/YrhL